jgi:hypothetical protein
VNSDYALTEGYVPLCAFGVHCDIAFTCLQTVKAMRLRRLLFTTQTVKAMFTVVITDCCLLSNYCPITVYTYTTGEPVLLKASPQRPQTKLEA